MSTLDHLKHYYGKVLSTSADLQTNVCCTGEAPPEGIQRVLDELAPAVVERYFGCGLVVPSHLEGLRVLDLGCGAGRDVYLLSRLVGERGSVVGVDMTREQLDVAEAHREEHARRFGYERSNVRFVQGELERLDDLDLMAGSFDLVVSNCVINLVEHKDKVLRDVYQLLKPGGELYFSDVYADRRVPPSVANDPLLYAECLGGALYWRDLIALAKQAGFADPRLVRDSPVTVDDPALAAAVGGLRFFSATYRLFRLDGLEPGAEDYGQSVVYRGTADGDSRFVLDKRHVFERGTETPVSGNTWRMLHDTRFRDDFDFLGDGAVHAGPFGDAALPFDAAPATSAGSCCC